MQLANKGLEFAKAKHTFAEAKKAHFDYRHLSSPRRMALRLGEAGRVGTKMPSFSTLFWLFFNTINATLVIFYRVFLESLGEEIYFIFLGFYLSFYCLRFVDFLSF